MIFKTDGVLLPKVLELKNLIIIFSAEYLIFLLGLPLWYFLLTRERKLVLKTVISLVVSVGLSSLIKIFYPIPRPFVIKDLVPLISQPTDGSFPSTHAAVAFVLAIFFFSKEKKLGLLTCGGALLISWARVWAGVHYWQDIGGGLILAFFVSVIVHKLLDRQAPFFSAT